MKNKRIRPILWKIPIYVTASFVIIFFTRAIEAEAFDPSGILAEMFSEGRTYWQLPLLTAAMCLISAIPTKTWRSLFRHRFLIAAVVFLILVALGVNGSSIGNWNLYLGVPDTGNLFGVSRLVRTDEWSLFTPMSLSQYLNPNGRFAYFSPIMRGVDTEMFSLYGQPVFHPAAIFRPFFWGYLFLPQNQGIAWYWCGRLIALVLVSLEFGLLITKGKKKYSLCYALLLALSPFVQWWFSINSLVEMLIAAQLSIVLFQHYLETDKTAKRAMLAAGIFWCAGAFVLAFYPSWMVPVFYLILLLIIWTLIEKRKAIRFSWKDVLILAGLLVFTAGLLGHAFYKSRHFIELMLNTVYPGARYMNGGEGAGFAFRYIESIWQPIDGVISEEVYVICDSALMICLSPLPYLLAILVFFREKKRDLLSILLFCTGIFFQYFAFFGIPEFLDRLLLLNYVGGNRLTPVTSLFELILLFRSISLLEKPVGVKGCLALSLGTAVFVFVYNYLIFFRFPSIGLYLVTFVVFWLLMLLFTAVPQRKKLSSWLVFAVLIITYLSGGLVNPVRRGVSDVINNPTLQTIRNVQTEEEGLWAVISDYPRTNIPLLAGVPCVNSTNIYPNLEEWRKLDEQGEDEFYYNRYAHISMRLKAEGKAEFSLLNPDYINLDITLADLRKLGVDYIIAQADSLDMMDTDCRLKAESAGYYIYRISE